MNYVVYGNYTMTSIEGMKVDALLLEDFNQSKLLDDGRQHFIDWISLGLLVITIITIKKLI